MNTEDVSRGYNKIEGAARAFNFDFRGKTVLDIGSSTGGFTEYALSHGATKVIAVEKGSHQMKAPLRFDPRIELHEKTDIFDVVATPTRASMTMGEDAVAGPTAYCRIPSPDVVVADVSFISLTKVLKYAKIKLARNDTQFLVMLKPQFEAKPYQLKNGIVKNESIRRDIIKNFEAWLKQNNFIIVNKRDNSLKGKHGNTERFYQLDIAKA